MTLVIVRHGGAPVTLSLPRGYSTWRLTRSRTCSTNSRQLQSPKVPIQCGFSLRSRHVRSIAGSGTPLAFGNKRSARPGAAGWVFLECVFDDCRGESAAARNMAGRGLGRRPASNAPPGARTSTCLSRVAAPDRLPTRAVPGDRRDTRAPAAVMQSPAVDDHVFKPPLRAWAQRTLVPPLPCVQAPAQAWHGNQQSNPLGTCHDAKPDRDLASSVVSTSGSDAVCAFHGAPGAKQINRRHTVP